MKIKNQFLFFLLLMLSTIGFSQKNLDKNTKVKPNSIINQESKEKGFELLKLEMVPCEGEESFNLMTRIVSVEKSGDTTQVTVNFVSDCCRSFYGELKSENDSTLNLIASSDSGDICLCYCCYYLTYSLKTKNNFDYNYEFNGEPIHQSDVKIYSPYKSTFEKYYRNGNIKEEYFLIDLKVYKIIHYDKKGNIKREEVFEPTIDFKYIDEL